MIRYDLLLVTALACAGCSTRNPIPADVVLTHGNCKIMQAGVRAVTYDEVAELRGSTLLNMTTPAPHDEPDVVLLAVSKGQQPTTGYRFEMSEAFAEHGTATVELRWVEPDRNAMLPQVITRPCIVVGLERGAFDKVRVIDDRGTLIGEIPLQPLPSP